MGVQNQRKNCFVIGLTGNIGTGKSTILNMLRHLGAYGIDADDLTKKVYAHPAAQKKIIAQFGIGIAAQNGQIDRAQIAKIVFKDTQALRDLENIIHPFVSTAAVHLINASRLPIIIIEAIKLLESDLKTYCDSIWVVDANTETIVRRLSEHRGMDIEQIQGRLSHQSPAQEKIAEADIVITNNDHLRSTWQQVNENWRTLCEKNIDFAKVSEQSGALLQELSARILPPFPEDLINLAVNFQKGEELSIFPFGRKLTESDLELFSTNGMIFTQPDAHENGFYSTWKLETFSLSCQAFICARARTNDLFTALPLSEIENLANLHQVSEIVTPAHPSLKEESRLLQEAGYTLASQNRVEHTQWNKAGYNLLIKRLWDTAVIFEKEKSP